MTQNSCRWQRLLLDLCYPEEEVCFCQCQGVPTPNPKQTTVFLRAAASEEALGRPAFLGSPVRDGAVRPSVRPATRLTLRARSLASWWFAAACGAATGRDGGIFFYGPI